MKNSFFSLLSYAFTITILSTFNSCKNNATDSSGTNNFLFQVTVKNSTGQPVQGLRISAFNRPFNFEFPKRGNNHAVNKITSTSSIKFDLAKSCRVTLSLHELSGTKKQEPISDQLLQFGAYIVALKIIDATAGTRVYKVVLTAIDDTTKAQLFKDSVYITLWQPDPSLSVLDYTSSAGTVETSDSLLFPQLLTLPVMVRTNEMGDSLGILTFPDDVVITVTDTAAQQSEQFIKKVVEGRNEFELIWNPSPTLQATKIVPTQYFNAAKADTSVGPVVTPTRFRLYQNYPNPFN